MHIHNYLFIFFPDGVDSTNSPGESPATPAKSLKDEEELNIHPRKRKIKRSEQFPSSNQNEAENQDQPSDNNNMTKKEKVPNPIEIYLTLRKKVIVFNILFMPQDGNDRGRCLF